MVNEEKKKVTKILGDIGDILNLDFCDDNFGVFHLSPEEAMEKIADMATHRFRISGVEDSKETRKALREWVNKNLLSKIEYSRL